MTTEPRESDAPVPAAATLAEAAAAVSAGDLQALALLHGRFESTRLSGSADLAAPAKAAEDQLQALILGEASDPAAVLAAVGEAARLVDELAGLAGPAPAKAPAVEPAVEPESVPEPAPEPAQASAAHDLTESPANEEDLPLLAEFVGEAGGHIGDAETALLTLEADPGNEDAVNAVFRAFHTVKGVAGFLNLRQIGALAHVTENLLDLVRKGQLSLDSGRTDIVLEAVDKLKGFIEQVAGANGAALATDPSLPALLERLEAATVAGATVEPKAAPAKAEEPEADAPAKAAAPKAAAAAEQTVKVGIDRLDRLIDMVGELVIAQSMVGSDVASLASADARLARNIAHLGKITRELQDLSMSMRMVPINGVFGRMGRLVRDTAKRLDKKVTFETAGGETELDRTLIEQVADPLVHMIRNSVDHGIEPDPADRTAAGKPEAGTVKLRAYHEGGSVVIEIADDGRGLPREKLLAKARAAGIIPEGVEPPDAEIHRLIFHPGLSTADQVTDVSGRGVGMDVVKQNIESLRGRIEIASTPGKGSTFTIRLPLTLAVIDGQIMRVGSERYVLPITGIESSVRPTAGMIKTVHGRGEMVNLRGDLLPLARLHNLFGVEPASREATSGLLAIVRDDDRRCAVLVDELLGQQQVVIKSLSSLIGTSTDRMPGVSGGAILGDGRVSLILDVPGLIELAAAG